MITDISAFKPPPPQGTQELERGQSQLRESGMGWIIRVVGKEVIAQMQLRRTSKETGVVWESASSIVEAEQMLEG